MVIFRTPASQFLQGPSFPALQKVTYAKPDLEMPFGSAFTPLIPFSFGDLSVTTGIPRSLMEVELG